MSNMFGIIMITLFHDYGLYIVFILFLLNWQR